MRAIKGTPVNVTRMARVNTIWNAVLDEVLQRGFHGTASIELQIDNGTIQWITQSVKRVEKCNA